MSKPIVTTNRLLIYIRRNPGLTAHQLYKLTRPHSTINPRSFVFGSRLYKLVKKGLITRSLGQHSTSDKVKAYRYYPACKDNKIQWAEIPTYQQ